MLVLATMGLVAPVSGVAPVAADTVGDVLQATVFAAGTESNPCPTAPTRHYAVVAMQVPLSYNRFGDFDPHGRLFVPLENVPALASQVSASLRAGGQAKLAQAMTGLGAAITDVTSITPTAADPAGSLAEAVAAMQEAANDAILVPAGADPNDPTDLTMLPDLPRFAPTPLMRPYVPRAHLGDCVMFHLLNALPEPVGLSISAVHARPGQGMALGANAPDLAAPGAGRTYTVHIPNLPGLEGSHFLQSGADPRFQTKHGLFGALQAEKPGTVWTARDGSADPYDTQAIIAHPTGSDFREYVLIYHDEIEAYDHTGRSYPVVSPFGEYGPGSKGMNLRSEPFLVRFNYVDHAKALGLPTTGHDKSQGYGSYTHGDPATEIPLAYLGDPVKWRLVNAGPGQSHVHHLHGGGIRWRASPVSEDTQFDDGFLKTNPVPVSNSERLDVQNMGVGEAFNAEPEGGAGGVQQVAGDFLFHCHIVEHYVGGMWSFWRVYNTKQPGLAKLPDRLTSAPDAVPAKKLVGKTMPGGKLLGTVADVEAWVEAQLPARGVPGPDDASVWDWDKKISGLPTNIHYFGEPETTVAWPNYRSPTPGQRPEILFNPVDGKVAYPLLRPHLGERPPFAPEHGPAPYLTPDVTPHHPDGLCPGGARKLPYNIVALSTPVPLNAEQTDPNGEIFVHAEDKADVISGDTDATSMVLRANQGDCVDVTFSSDLSDTDANGNARHSKVNMHIHLVQFDVQASDGVITGLAYEQSVRPADVTGTKLSLPAAAGATTITVENTDGIRIGTLLGISLTEPTFEMREVTAVTATTVTLDAPLAQSHPADDRVGYEFVRYRWYPDVELGMVYWHDHVDGLNSWRHGLFGGLVVEPAGSNWCDPKRADALRTSCSDLRSGHMADIVAGAGGTKSYREFVVQVQDRACLLAQCSPDVRFPEAPNEFEPASLGLRSAPFDHRNADAPLRSAALYKGSPQGDPATDLWETYPKDPVVVRLLYAGQSTSTGVGTFGVTGHRFQFEQHNPGSRLTDSLSFGISSQHNVRLDGGAGGSLGLAGDYLYGMNEPDLLRRGAWGILRVHDETHNSADGGGLQLLPNNLAPAPGTMPTASSPGVTGTREYEVVALQTDLSYNNQFGIHAPTKIFALLEDRLAIESGQLRPTPLVLRALPGELVTIHLTNALPSGNVAVSAAMVQAQPGAGYGIDVGDNAVDSIPPSQTRSYTWWADAEVGAAYFASLADPDDDATEGLYGALVVEPAGSTFAPATGPSADIDMGAGGVAREHVLLYGSHDPLFESSNMPYLIDVQGLTNVNYRTEPLAYRVGGTVNMPPPPTNVLTAPTLGGLGLHTCQLDRNNCGGASSESGLVRFELRNPLNALAHAMEPPETPTLDVKPGQTLVVRSINAAGDQHASHAVAGHWWAVDPDMPGCRTGAASCKSNLVAVRNLGLREADNAWIPGAGAGGAGEYLYGNMRQPFHEDGAWGVVRVCSPPPLADVEVEGGNTTIGSDGVDLGDPNVEVTPQADDPLGSAACFAGVQGGAAWSVLRDTVGASFGATVESLRNAAADPNGLVSALQALGSDPAGNQVCRENTETTPGNGDTTMPPGAAGLGGSGFGFVPGCVVIRSGHTFAIHNRDAITNHNPGSLRDLTPAVDRCFVHTRDQGGNQAPRVSWTAMWSYDGTDLRFSNDGGATWRDCNKAKDPARSDADHATVPYRCDIHPGMVGTLVVRA